MSHASSVAIHVAVILAVLVAYIAPAMIALIRQTTNATQVFFINLFTGWSVVGWIVALCMAFSGKPAPEMPSAQYGWYKPGRRQGPLR